MAYHHACFEAKRGPTSRKAPAKYDSVCQLCGQTIRVGQLFTWTPRNGPSGYKKPHFSAQSGSSVHHGDTDAGAYDPATSTPVEPVPPSAEEVAHMSSIMNLPALAEALVPHLEGKVGTKLNTDDFKEHIARIIADAEAKVAGIGCPTTVEVKVHAVDGSITTVDAGVQHRMFPRLLKAVTASRSHPDRSFGIWLAGPSGSGKTSAAIAVARTLGMPFYYTGAINDKFELTGYNDATGKYIRTPLRDAYENGGLFCFDEVDASDPSALLCFNALLTNGYAAFPDAVVKRHPDFVAIATANTFGHGGTHEYVGRMKQDAAFIKRFYFIDWGYDWDMVMATCSNKKWAKHVRVVSERVAKAGIRVLVTPREVYVGELALAAGEEWSDVEAATIRSGMTVEQWEKVSVQ